MRALRAGLTAVLLLALPAIAAPLTLERITSRPSIAGVSPSAPAWSPKGDRLAFLWAEGGAGEKDVFVVGREGGAPARLTKSAKGIGSFAWLPDGAGLVYLAGGEIFRVGAGGGEPARLVEGKQDRSDLAVSPDGRFVSWIQEGDLWWRALSGGEPERITHVYVAAPSAAAGTYAHPDVELGRAVWGETAAYLWSPDGKTIAVHHVDRRKVRKVGFPSYLTEEPTLQFVRRTAPGDVNEERTIGLVDVQSRKLRLLDLPRPDSIRVIEYSWSANNQLLIDRETDDAVDHWLHVAAPPAHDAKEVWHDHGDRRIYSETTSAWSADGERILFTGDLDDRYRLYSLAIGDSKPKALTSGPHDVQGAALTAKGTKQIYYVSTEPNPAERQVHRIDETGQSAQVTHLPGAHRPLLAPDGRTLALLYSNDTSPPELYLLSTEHGSREQRITQSTPAEFDQIQWAKPRYVTFPGTTSGVPLHARIFEPANLDKSKRHPVLFGPVYSNTVRNRWGGPWGLLQQVLVDHGYIVVQVDSRGSTGYGREFREKFLMDAGSGDLDDYESAVAYMKTLPYVDSKRIGIFGSSYGGTLTIFSLFKKPGLFAAGVAGAPATDPKWFGSDDVAIIRTPQSHPEAFARGKAMQYAKDLRDPLLIIHGMADDVVPFQTSVQLADQLIKLGKDFDFAFAPGAVHGWSRNPAEGRYLLKKLIDHFDRYIGPGGR